MAKSNVPIYPQTISSVITQFANGDSTTAKVILAAGTNGTKIEAIFAYSTDTSARDFQIIMYNGTTQYVLTTISIAIGSGNTNSVPNVNLLNNTQWVGLPIDAFGNKYLLLPVGYSLYGAMGAQITSAKVVNIFVQSGDY